MTKYLFLVLVPLFLFSCAIPQEVLSEFNKKPAPAQVDVSADRDGMITRIDIAVGSQDFDYTAEMSKNGRKAVVIIKNGLFKMGSQALCRPISKMNVTESEQAIKFEIYLAGKSELSAERMNNWVRLTFRAMEPDMEMVAMETYGSWIRPLLGAYEYKGVDNGGGRSVIRLNSYPAYATGRAGGRYYLDVYGVRIPAGNVKYSGLTGSTMPEGKSRLLFSSAPDFCVKDFNITLGKRCAGYSSLFDFRKEVKNGSESFSCTLTGQPQVMERSMKGLTAFGMRNVRLFGSGMDRYDDEKVYKVETREKDGITWLVFLHEPEMRYKTYFSGDRFFVVFY